MHNPVAAQGRGNIFDPSKAWGPAQHPPLTPEYQARYDANLAEQEAGGQSIGETYTCTSPGMPRVTNAYGQTEFVVTPGTTHILVENIRDSRRIFTDGRDFTVKFEPSYLGYSIGKWIDTDGDGKYDVLEVETRGFLRDRAPMMPAAFRCTTTIRRSSRSASISTGTTATCCCSISRSSTMR